MPNKIEHYVFMVVDSKLLTDELKKEFLELVNRVKIELDINVSNNVVFSQNDANLTTGIITVWTFDNEREKDLFRNSQAHREHINRVGKIIIDKYVYDYFQR